MSTLYEHELETFRQALPGLLAESNNRGRFALVTSDRVVGVYSSYEDAVLDGYRQFEDGTFLVKEIVEREEPRYFSRNIVPCQSSPAPSLAPDR